MTLFYHISSYWYWNDWWYSYLLSTKTTIRFRFLNSRLHEADEHVGLLQHILLEVLLVFKTDRFGSTFRWDVTTWRSSSGFDIQKPIQFYCNFHKIEDFMVHIIIINFNKRRKVFEIIKYDFDEKNQRNNKKKIELNYITI